MNMAKKAVNLLKVSDGHSFFDVGAGTGILYYALRDKKLSEYVAVDISENMLSELRLAFPEANTMCLDFDKKIILNKKFDYVVIFNSIPHFENMNVVFENAKSVLNKGGKFSIVHGRTREGLKLHHKKIGYSTTREPIPNNETLNKLSKEYEFKNVEILDQDFFYFSCKKDE